MNKMVFVLAPLLVLLTDCSGESSHSLKKYEDSLVAHSRSAERSSSDTLAPLSVETYEVPVENTDASYMGYLEGSETAGFGSGPGAIAVGGKYIFIVDTYHKNVKRIDMETKSVMASSRFVPDDTPPPMDVMVQSENVYILNRSDTLYVLDQNLVLKEKVVLPSEFWRSQQYFLQRTDNLADVHVYSPITNQLVTVSTNGLKVDSVDRDSMLPGYNMLYNENASITPNSDSTMWYAKLPDGAWLRLPDQLPELDLWWAKNITADTHRFVYFNVTKEKFEVHVYTY